jgi:mannosyltransferase
LGDAQAGRSPEGVMHLEERQMKEKKPRGRNFFPHTPSGKATTRYEWSAAALLLATLIVLAFALRFWRLGDWNFQATEVFTLRDSDSPQFGNPRPLMYLLNYYVLRPLVPLDEFGLRLLPALFGVLAIPAFYFVIRRLVGTRAALFGTLLLAISPLHILYSQLARYWSLVFLLSAIYPVAIYLGVRERNHRMLALGVVTGILAVLAHPVAILLVGGMVLFLGTRVRRQQLARLWGQKTVRWTAYILLVLIAVTAVRFIPMLQGWISQHDRNPGYGQFLLRPPPPPGLKQVFYVFAYFESLTLPLVMSAAGGMYLLWQQRERSLALFLFSLAIFPIAFLALLSLRTSVSAYYLLPSAPAFFIGAGVFLDRLLDVDGRLRPRWLLPAAVTVLIIATGAPTLLSDYRDGRRYDFRGAAHWLRSRVAPGDIIFSDQPMVLAHYLPPMQVQHLRHDPVPLMHSIRELRQPGRGGVLWIVAPAPSHAFRTNLRHHGLISWIYDNCQLRKTLGVGRVDFRQQYLQVYRCPPGVPEQTNRHTDAA